MIAKRVSLAFDSQLLSFQILQRIVLVLNSNKSHFPIRRLDGDALRLEDDSQIINGIITSIFRVIDILHI